MAAQKKMTIRVIRDGLNDLRFTAPQTRANLDKLVELFGVSHEIVPRNNWGRNGMPADVRKARDAAAKAAKAKASKPTVKKTPAKKNSAPKVSKPVAPVATTA